MLFLVLWKHSGNSEKSIHTFLSCHITPTESWTVWQDAWKREHSPFHVLRCLYSLRTAPSGTKLNSVVVWTVCFVNISFVLNCFSTFYWFVSTRFHLQFSHNLQTFSLSRSRFFSTRASAAVTQACAPTANASGRGSHCRVFAHASSRCEECCTSDSAIADCTLALPDDTAVVPSCTPISGKSTPSTALNVCVLCL